MLRFAVDVGGTIRESRIQLLRALSRLTITALLRIRWAYHCFNPAQAAALYSYIFWIVSKATDLCGVLIAAKGT